MVELNSFMHNMNIKQKLQLGICLWVLVTSMDVSTCVCLKYSAF